MRLPRLTFWRSPLEDEARQAARRACAASHPDEKIEELRLRASEPDRFVFAVIIRSPLPRRGMPIYHLFAVARDLSSCEELAKDSGSPYVLRGIK